MNVEKKPVHVSTGFSASQANCLHGINLYPMAHPHFHACY